MFPELLGEPFANKNTKLSIDGKVVKRLIAEGREAFPFEYTALLAGKGSEILGHFPAPAAQRELYTFQWNGPALLTALRAIKQDNLVWLGVLHTHPHSPAQPSVADIKGWHYPTLSYWILAFPGGEPDLRLYQQVDRQFVERPYRII